jgi:uncharacterized membrane protein
MAGGISLFLLFVIIVAAIVLLLMFTSLGTALGLRQERQDDEDKRRGRPTHAVARDDGSSRAERGETLQQH